MMIRRLVAAAALAAATVPAFAVIQYNNAVTFADNNATEFTLVVWSETAQASYTQDLGWTIGQFLAAAQVPGTTTFTVTTDLTSHANLAGAADLQWAVFALDHQPNGLVGPGIQRMYTTVSAITDPSNFYSSDQILSAISASFDAFIGQTSVLPTHSNVANGSNYAVPADGDAYWLGNGMPAGTGAGFLPFSQGNAVNTASGLFYMTGFDADFYDITGPMVLQPGALSFNGTTLTYIQEVPEVQTAAMLAAGLLALGLIGRRRTR